MRLIDADKAIKYLTKARMVGDSRPMTEIFAEIPSVDVLDKIRAEIKRPLEIEKYADTDSAKAQAIALNWCIEIIDKYRKEQE